MSTWNFQELNEQLDKDIQSIRDVQTLEALRIKYLGKKGLIPQIYASLSTATNEEKPIIGKNANDLRVKVTQYLDEKKEHIKDREKQSKTQALDITLPGVSSAVGHQHILTQTIDEICQIFERLGFVIQEGPEIETEFNNFTALSITVDHPSRDAFDTFYL